MKITLDSIRQSIATKYASFDIELSDGSTVSLRNPLRMSRDDRKAMTEFDERMKGADGDAQFALLGELVTLVASDKAQAKKLLKQVNAAEDGDVLLMEIVNQYTEAQQAGEASPSES